MFLDYIMTVFKSNLTPFSEKLAKSSKNNIIQLVNKYIKYFAKYEYLYEIFFSSTSEC